MNQAVISVRRLSKVYGGSHQALKDIDLDIYSGEIFAILGPNGAGKTTLISIICGIVNPGTGQVTVGGFDVVKHYRQARSLIGLVPQELTTDTFETVWNTVSFTRGLFGKPPDPGLIEKILRDLALWDKKDSKIMTLSGGMKRRVLIAKALSHEPSVLFLDEPSAGVDVELRRSMWEQVNELRRAGVTIILTTHYIEEAEKMADRIGVINKGEIIVVEEKETLMKKMGNKNFVFELEEPVKAVPDDLRKHSLMLTDNGLKITYTSDSEHTEFGVSEILKTLSEHNIRIRDLNTRQSSLEDIFTGLVN